MSDNTELLELHDRWILPIKNWTVSRFIVDYALEIIFTKEDESAGLRIEGEYSLQRDKSSLLLKLDDLPSMGELFTLFNQNVTSAFVYKVGSLVVELSNGAVLSINPNTRYEAWAFYTLQQSSSGLRLVCTPGGKVSIWR